MAIRESMTMAGDFARSSLYPVRRSARGSRRGRAKPTTEAMAKLNEKYREDAFADILHTNFGPDDVFLTLTYAAEHMPQTPEEAGRRIANYLRRVAYRCRKLGLGELMYVYVTERGAKSGRIHHHVFITGLLDRDTLEEIWGLGYANSRRLDFCEHGIRGLAKYALKSGTIKPEPDEEENEKVGYRTWSGSKNLAKPKKKQNDYRIKAKDVAYIDAHPDDYAYIQKLYPGYFVARVVTTACSEDTEDKTPIPRAHFVTLYLYRADTRLFGWRRMVDKLEKGERRGSREARGK